MPDRIVIVGGGQAGMAVARRLDSTVQAGTEIVVVEPRPAFFHVMGSLRALVSPEWVDRVWLPYEGSLTHGRVVTGRVRQVTDGVVELESGEVLEAGAIIVATGSRLPRAVDPDDADLAERAAAVASASSVVVLGAGPTAVELCGELRHSRPGLRITLVGRSGELLPDEGSRTLRLRTRRLVDQAGVTVVLDDTVDGPIPDDVVAGRTVTTRGGMQVDADLVLAAYGRGPRSKILGAEHLNESGRVKVDRSLLVHGMTRVLAVGDVTDLPEPKTAFTAARHAKPAAATVLALLSGTAPAATWKPASRTPMIVPFGPSLGAARLPIPGPFVFGSWVTTAIKGRDLLLPTSRALVGA